MEERRTPIGFLAGDIGENSHCVYTYLRRDERLVKSIALFLQSGLRAGETSVCLADDDMCLAVVSHLDGLGISDGTPSLIVRGHARPAGDKGIRHVGHLTGFVREHVRTCRTGQATRIFADFGDIYCARNARFKLLEYEAEISLHCPLTVMMCGYQICPSARTRLTQIRRAHPYLANDESIRRNPYYVEPSRLLASLHKYRRVSRKYPALEGQTGALQEDIEETAARTPLSVADITCLQEAAGQVFTHLVDKCRPASETALPHFHVIFAPDPERFLITLRMHDVVHDTAYAGAPDLRTHARSWSCFAGGGLDDVDVESWRGEVVITLVKRY